MPRGIHKADSPKDPLTPEEREEYEEDLISFSDRELDLLGDIQSLNGLYAGGISLLWLEGLSQRIGPNGSLTALDSDVERVEESRLRLKKEADLTAPVRLAVGDVFSPPFERGAFDLAYSAGLFHELDVRERPARNALAALAAAIRPGGRVATSDFVDAEPAVQLEEEELERQLARETRGAQLYGIGPPQRLVALHESLLKDAQWQILAPFRIRHLDKLVLAEHGPEEAPDLPATRAKELSRRRNALLQRIEREGYTRPATLHVQGFVTGR